MKRQQLISICVWSLWACSGGGDYAKAPPPPAPPPAPAAVPAPSQPEPVAAPSAPAAPEPSAAKLPSSKPASNKASTKKSSTTGAAAKVTPAAAPAPAKPAAPAPTTSQPAAPAAKPSGKVSVPSTAHVRVEVPAALQGELDRDPRMQPWVNQVIGVIDRCYKDAAGSGGLAGTIEVVVTMHENERPDADIKSLPPQLSPIVACATGGLMRTKMPLFTGAEGGRRTVRIVFK